MHLQSRVYAITTQVIGSGTPGSHAAARLEAGFATRLEDQRMALSCPRTLPPGPAPALASRSVPGHSTYLAVLAGRDPDTRGADRGMPQDVVGARPPCPDAGRPVPPALALLYPPGPGGPAEVASQVAEGLHVIGLDMHPGQVKVGCHRPQPLGDRPGFLAGPRYGP